MSNYGSTGDNLLAKVPYEGGDGAYSGPAPGQTQEQYEAVGNSPGWEERWAAHVGGGETRYDQWTDAALNRQLSAAEAQYANAARRGELQAAQLRSGAMRDAMGGLAGGGLGARQAIMGVGQTSWGAGQEGARMGSQDRLAAAQSYMMAQQQQARYEQARNEAWKQRFLSDQERARAADQAYRERKAREEAAARQAIGAVLGAGGAGMGAASKADTQEKQGNQGGGGY